MTKAYYSKDDNKNNRDDLLKHYLYLQFRQTMLSKVNQLTLSYEQKHGFRPNLLYVNTAQLELLKEQLSEPEIEILAQLIGMDIVIVESSTKAHVSWAQITWKHSKTA